MSEHVTKSLSKQKIPKQNVSMLESAHSQYALYQNWDMCQMTLPPGQRTTTYCLFYAEWESPLPCCWHTTQPLWNTVTEWSFHQTACTQNTLIWLGGQGVKSLLFVDCLRSPSTCKGILRDGSAETIVHAATLRQKLRIWLVTAYWHQANQP